MKKSLNVLFFVVLETYNPSSRFLVKMTHNNGLKQQRFHGEGGFYTVYAQ